MNTPTNCQIKIFISNTINPSQGSPQAVAEELEQRVNNWLRENNYNIINMDFDKSHDTISCYITYNTAQTPFPFYNK